MIVLAGESGRKREGKHVTFEVNMIVINYNHQKKKKKKTFVVDPAGRERCWWRRWGTLKPSLAFFLRHR